jgi:hypothetical protein
VISELYQRHQHTTREVNDENNQSYCYGHNSCGFFGVFATALSVEAKKGIRIHKKKTGDYQSTPHNR